MNHLSSAVRTAKSVITANSPVLLVGTAIAGVVATGVLAAKGGYKARGIIDAAEDEKGEELSTQEKVQLTWLCYAVPAITGASTIAAAVGVHTIHTKRHAALAGLYAVTSNKLDDYREKAEELMGPKKTQELNDGVAQKAVDRNPVEDNEVIITGHGTELCYDEWSGRYFLSSVSKMEDAANSVNRMLIDEGDVSLNDFYEFLGIPPIPMGASFGWSGAKITPKFGSTLSPDGRPAISIWFHETPKPDFGIRNR